MESLKSQFKIKSRGNAQQFFTLAILFLLPFYFIKLKYGWISFNLPELLITVLFLFWIFNKSDKYEIRNTKYEIPVALIITGLLLSAIINKNYYTGLGILKGWFVLPMIFAAIFFDNLKKNKELLSWSLQALFYSGVFVSIEGIYYWFSGLLAYDGRLRIYYDSPNQLAMFLSPLFIISLFLFLKEKEKIKKFIFGIGLAIIGLNLYFTFSYGAWLAAGVSLGVVFWLIYSKFLKKKIVAPIIILLVVFLAGATYGKLASIEKENLRSSLASRTIIWKSAGLMLKNNPLFGIGPGNFQEKYLEYQKYFPPYLEWAVPQPHNLFLAFWLESGLAGLFGFVFLLVQFFRDNKKAIGNNRLYGSLCLALMLYFLIHGLVDTTYWRNDMAILFWAVIAVNFYLAAGSLGSALRRSG